MVTPFYFVKGLQMKIHFSLGNGLVNRPFVTQSMVRRALFMPFWKSKNQHNSQLLQKCYKKANLSTKVLFLSPKEIALFYPI